MFTRNLFNNNNGNGNALLANDSKYNITLNPNQPQNLEYSSIIRSPSLFLTLSFTSSTTYETLSAALIPNIVVADTNGVILYSSDDIIKIGSNYMSPENLVLLEKGYDPLTSGFLKTVLQNMTNNNEKSYRDSRTS